MTALSRGPLASVPSGAAYSDSHIAPKLRSMGKATPCQAQGFAIKLSVHFVQLPVQFDTARLAAEIQAFDSSCWRKHPQNFPGNFALPLIAVNGDADADAINGPLRATPYLNQCPYLTQVLHRLGAVWGRTRLMKLSGHAEVTPHADVSYYWRERARVHVPILTKPTVRFICGESEVNMAAGECWIFDTWRNHRVINADDDERIHLVADTVGSDDFWSLVNRGRPVKNAGDASWHAEPLAAQLNEFPELAYEAVNVPLVMTPWELQSHLVFLFGEVIPHPELAEAQAISSRLMATWRTLWAQYGTDRSGWPSYRQALDRFDADMQAAAPSLRAVHGAKVLRILKPMLLDVALADQGLDLGAYEPRKPEVAAVTVGEKRDEIFDRPIFIISSPRSGSTMLFEALAQAQDLYTIGQESHALIEGVPALNPASRHFASNRLEAADATPELGAVLRQRFLAELRDRDGRIAPSLPVRMLEKTPKNALRIPFLAQLFPQAQFVYLHRDIRQTLSSMIEAWQSGRFRTYPHLPGWTGPSWSLLLVPGWKELIGRPLQEIVAAQWEITANTLLDDLAAVPADRVHRVRYDEIVADPTQAMQRLSSLLGLAWDRPIDGSLPLSRFTVSEPSPEKWRRHEALINQVLPSLEPTLERLERFMAGRNP
jgi:hypothetical protein